MNPDEKREITKELQESYLDYAMSVIVSRALPDVRDGLKPVQRRVLWAMWDSGLTSTSKFRKSANVVGETLGRYHPHGDSSVYDALVRMAQDFSLRYPLVHGQGNFGNVDGDSAAAMRYTEVKMSKIAEELLVDIEKETVDWQPNYDGSRQEPKVLPAKLPNLLLNGTVGIAVGMATNIPPHNLGELVDAILHLTKHPEATVADLCAFVHGPDFPTGGIIFDKKAIETAYTTGRGGVTTRAKTEIAERKNGQFDIIVTEIPYQVNKSELIRKIAELVIDKRIEGIRTIRDESDRDGMRIVIELKGDAAPQKVLNQLYKFTDLQKDFHFNMLALENGLQPQLMSLRDILWHYVEYRKIVIRRRTEFDLRKARERAHILEGLVKALDVIDKVIATIRKSANRDEAHRNLEKIFGFTGVQATAILEMRLQTLAARERDRIIKELEDILKHASRIVEIIQDELRGLKDAYGDARRTQVVPHPIGEFKMEDLVPQEEAMITFSAGGYIKRLPPDTFKTQKRGGKGLIGSDVAEEDFLKHFMTVNTHDNLLFFTNKGRVFQTKAYEIPEATRTSKGKAIHNFLELPSDEAIQEIVNYNESSDAKAFLVMVTARGVVKKTALADFSNIRRTGIIAISLDAGDSLNGVRLSRGKDQIILTTRQGQSIRFSEQQVRAMGRTASGVTGMKLKKDDAIAAFDVVAADIPHDAKLLVVMENGFGKQTLLKEYKSQHRSGSGIRTATVTSKTGQVIGAYIITTQEEIFALSAKGQVIRTDLSSIRMTGRAAQGVRLMNVETGDRLAAVAIL
jgi:DNA gyrase subunit A